MLPPIALPQIDTGPFRFGQASKRPAVFWRPNPDHPDGRPNPQRLAYESQADVLGYGGAAGGGKTDLALGLACTQHHRAAIFRRVAPNLKGIIERGRELFPESAGHKFNETLHRWRLSDGRLIELESCQYEKNKEDQRGRPRDLFVFDEATEFTRSQVEFITAWNRSTRPGQRCRVVLPFNPPLEQGGSWVIDYFLPWFAHLFPDQFQHPRPAAPGELRWYATLDGQEQEVENGQPITHKGETIRPRSRTFIPARLVDNPYLARTEYESVLQALPEPLRSQLLYGDVGASAEADPWQVIPAAWVRLAQRRWEERERPDTPLSAVGVDVARGGRDKLTMADRYDNWFAPVEAIPGVNVEDGPAAAGYLLNHLGGRVPGYVNLDVIAVGTSAYDSTKVLLSNVNPVNAAESSRHRDRSGKLAMRNIRAEMHWRLREALDPEHGDNLALPPGNEVVADLCAARWKLTAAGIQIEDKEEIKKRIGRSPDVGEAIMLAHMPSTRRPLFA